MASLPSVQDGKVILFGENPFIWLSQTQDSKRTTEASVWTITYSPKGSGHALFIKSELTQDKWRVYSDNKEMVRYLQETVQGMLNPQTADNSIPIIEASFSHSGDVRESWSQMINSKEDEIIMNWQEIQEPILVQNNEVIEANRPYGVSVIMAASKNASLTLNGIKAKGEIWPMDLNGHPFSTAALAFCENWREES